MANSKKPSIGDIFKVQLPGEKNGYVQYIGNDKSQLNSDVIRAFRKRYDKDANPTVDEIVTGEVDFYSHVVDVNAGINDGSWTKVGHSDNLGNIKAAFFRVSRDYGNPAVKVSKEWDVWTMNEPMVYIGELTGENIKADIGSVTWPVRVVARMQTGKYPVFYPDYK